jgi:hypothetical protein
MKLIIRSLGGELDGAEWNQGAIGRPVDGGVIYSVTIVGE